MELVHCTVQDGVDAACSVRPIEGNWTSTEPHFVNPGYWDPNGTTEDAEDDFWVNGDYHLKSQAGRWDPNSRSWVKDDVTSPCIDAGNPMYPIGLEPFPNGGIINIGAYGGTAEASKSYFGQPVCETIVAGDINGDCKVNFKDFALAAAHWLEDHRQFTYIQWLGHASVRIWSGDVVIYVDPRKLSDSPHDATLVLVTHTHSDHYSPTDIAKVWGPEAKLIAAGDVVAAEGKGQAILPGQMIESSGVRVTGVAAYNLTKPNHPKSKNWVGFIIEIGAKRIYCAGDTDLTEEMKALTDIDVAILPVGGMYTMDADEAAEATGYLKPELAIPYHWGDIVGSLSDAQRFAELAHCIVKIMTVGESIRL
jgi:L-ascorbate metabolism protein UlaG (beta-lactamase superfamily)